eukprot:8236420-Pyramimonas_sp.AAC.1
MNIQFSKLLTDWAPSSQRGFIPKRNLGVNFLELDVAARTYSNAPSAGRDLPSACPARLWRGLSKLCAILDADDASADERPIRFHGRPPAALPPLGCDRHAQWTAHLCLAHFF